MTSRLRATAALSDADLLHIVRGSAANYKINKGNFSKAIKGYVLTISTVEPAAPALNDIWIDTSE